MNPSFPLIPLTVPSPGESILQVEITRWLKEEGEWVEQDEELCELESDKATICLSAPAAGYLLLTVKAPHFVAVGSQIGTISPRSTSVIASKPQSSARSTPVLQRNEAPPLALAGQLGRLVRRVPMPSMRRKIAERLVAVSNETAMLTTFNEVNLQPVLQIRETYKDRFHQAFHTRLGMMSFFTKAAATALQQFPDVQARIDGNDILYHDYTDIGIAVSVPKGLVVPVIRDAPLKSIPQLEIEIFELAEKARLGKITPSEMAGGTFTITNGGYFGSLLATPLINPPQSAILGIHTIKERPITENGQIVSRPMMYIALSYDHRLIDGRESVTFLKRIKDLMEDPIRLLLKL